MNNKLIKAKLLLVCAITSVMISCNSNPTTGNEESKDVQTTTDSAVTQTTTTQPSVIVPAKNDTANAPEFQKTLHFKKSSFDITATGKGSLQQVTIQPHGLTDNKTITIKNAEPVVDAEVADLNGDGFAELVIYTQSAGSGSYGNVYGYSVNNGKSISAITFPRMNSNADISKGYSGHDKFKITNNQLVQRFPLYNTSDANSQPTGKQRTITYKLVDGEASRKFVVDKVTEE
jgi:hypothetical protein